MSPGAPTTDDRFALQAGARKRLARLLGRESLPALCVEELGACLAHHLDAARTERERKNNAAAGSIEEAIARACKTLEELVALDSGIDPESLRILRPHAKSFITAARDRIAELMRVPRAYSHHELLMKTGPFLRLIFERYVRGAANTRANLRLFALEALTAADIVKPRIHETRIERLDEYLDAAPYR